MARSATFARPAPEETLEVPRLRREPCLDERRGVRGEGAEESAFEVRVGERLHVQGDLQASQSVLREAFCRGEGTYLLIQFDDIPHRLARRANDIRHPGLNTHIIKLKLHVERSGLLGRRDARVQDVVQYDRISGEEIPVDEFWELSEIPTFVPAKYLP